MIYPFKQEWVDDECDQSNTQKITFSNNAKLGPSQIFTDSDGHLLLYYPCSCAPGNCTQCLDIRLASNISVLVKTDYSITSKKLDNVQISKEYSVIAYASSDNKHLIVYDSGVQQSGITDSVVFIECFDVSNGTTAVAGKDYASSNLLIVHKLFENQKLIQTSINSSAAICKLSNSGLKVAVYDQSSALSVWDVPTKTLTYQQAFDGVVNIKFLNETALLLHFSNSITIIALNKKEYVLFADGFNITQVAVNSEGNLIAQLINGTYVKIFDGNMNQISTFVPVTKTTLADVSFSPQNELLVITSLGILFVLTPNSCPTTFININSICVCPQTFVNRSSICTCPNNKTQISNKCVCKDNFMAQPRHQCMCPIGFYFKDENCSKCSEMCTQCRSEGTISCTSYSTTFYVIFAACAIVVIAIAIGPFLIKRTSREMKKFESALTYDETEYKREGSMNEIFLKEAE